MSDAREPGGKVPAYRVRFPCDEDFLVEYTDRIRHGLLDLPAEAGRVRGPVRLELHLPDNSVLRLVGVAEGPSAAEGGARVRLRTLPAAAEESLRACVERLTGGEDPGATTAPAERPPAVLLVDDHVGVRIDVGDSLRARGMRVRVAENGLAALSAALKSIPDLILTDVEMPVMDGWTLLRVVRQRKRLVHVPLVFFTNLDDDLSRLQGYRLGVDDYLSKDTGPDELAARLMRVIGRRRDAAPDHAQHGMRGDLRHVRLGSLLAFLESERRTGTLNVLRGSDTATLRLRDGRLESVENLGRFRHPHDRVFELLDWRQGEFEFLAENTPPVVDGPTSTPVSYLLMEHARREDETRGAR